VKIIAIGVANLTDARYFAAMGADWIGFSMGPDSPLSIEHVMAFADWVEGPEFFLDVRGRSEDQIAEMLGNFQAAGLLSDEGVALPHYAGKMITTYAHDDTNNDPTDILIYTHRQWLERTPDVYSNVAEEEWVKACNKEEYQSLKRTTDMISGIVVSGGEEQKVGIKSYEDLDELIECIRD